jgi:hypothetical protein
VTCLRTAHESMNRELERVALMLAEDIGARGWEKLRWRVSDAEEEFVSFFCAEIVR